jgi:pyruvate,orthophosphate dikinase
MKNLLGGKGANLAEMCRLGIPVPSGFTISTEACTVYRTVGRAGATRCWHDRGRGARWRGLHRAGNGQAASATPADPLLLSVRSGARASMPGMMDTILNLGLNDEAVAGLAPARPATSASPGTRYRRFIQMYGDVVMGLKPVSKEEHDPFEVIIDMAQGQEGRQARHRS